MPLETPNHLPVVIAVDWKMWVERTDHESNAQRIGFQCVPTTAHEQQTNSHIDGHVAAIQHVIDIYTHS